ncbi:MAG: DNA methyltransferase, partial [Pseudomonadota bacterium]
AKNITLDWNLERNPPSFEGNDIKFPESLARYFIENYSPKSGKVFDPFAGLGTTLFCAEELNRKAFGMEIERQKYEWVAAQIENWMGLVNDDAAKMDLYDFPKMDLILTSPPFMGKNHQWNPLYNGDPKKSGYETYLKRIKFILRKAADVLKKNGTLIIQVDNVKSGNIFTPLIYNIISCAKPTYKQIDEIKVNWKNPKPDYPYTTCLIFKKS